VESKLFWWVRFTSGEVFVEYRACDEERSSEAAVGGGRAAPRLA
jgi:hypothetical protein